MGLVFLTPFSPRPCFFGPRPSHTVIGHAGQKHPGRQHSDHLVRVLLSWKSWLSEDRDHTDYITSRFYFDFALLLSKLVYLFVYLSFA